MRLQDVDPDAHAEISIPIELTKDVRFPFGAVPGRVPPKVVQPAPVVSHGVVDMQVALQRAQQLENSMSVYEAARIVRRSFDRYSMMYGYGFGRFRDDAVAFVLS